MKNLVLLGGGYGNMRILLRLLPNQFPEDTKIILVDRNPFHSLKTEFYALAAGTTTDKKVRVDFPEHPRLEKVYGEITKIDRKEKKVYLQDGREIPYDDLVIGLGCEDDYHNVPGAAEHTLSIQTIANSRKTFETLCGLPAGSVVAIVGAGLSGIEIASELRESRKDLIIKLFDRSPRILRSFPEKLSRYIQEWFEKNNVEVIPESNITKVEPGKIYNHDEVIEVDAIVWTAGVQPVKIVREMDAQKDNKGRPLVNQYFQLVDDEHVYVVGDCASSDLPASAQLAEEQAERIAQVLKLRWKGEKLPEKMPPIKLKGFMGSLGKKQGFVYIADKTMTGRIARLLKSGLLWMYKRQNDN
ncbi:NAD(P)/FAD-dependent oxidoreductase [Ureibacillus sp. FSL K6-8385]|uniref:NAD(P)/FAD-dependent oxidoreductase n=1 Tax=Ureibacillus terrenus TaxID=118246 RepID=A0A540V0I9_9BACL|nr:NAD(P)/FAD-dependent oxidoreductase [Ureibacillus terrenus]MED3662397.1 NAD(P)/FAD-dependent oxidoreductase [Ureibacillus terrenus]MED3763753.1 NAD(P)/FAD-dependent oxidoreductase [Ureibacillus terrenus]TQE90266.1 NAD(P)/FAD-dependent oxidoreductase [Ureibacillus terrenus]